GGPNFFFDDRVRCLHDGDAFGGDGAEDADGEAGAGERGAADEGGRDAEHDAEVAHFVFEQLAQRLDELEAHALGQAADVVVALDGLRRPFERHRLDDVGIERALGEKADVAQLLGLFLEYLDEGDADDAPLLLRVFDAAQAIEEALRGVDGFDAEVKGVAEELHDALGLAAAQDAVFDEDAGELIADGAVHERRRHRRVDAAAQPAHHAGRPDAGADALDLALDEILHRPVGLGVADAEDEVLEQLAAARRVRDLGVKLDRVA